MWRILHIVDIFSPRVETLHQGHSCHLRPPPAVVSKISGGCKKSWRILFRIKLRDATTAALPGQLTWCCHQQQEVEGTTNQLYPEEMKIS